MHSGLALAIIFQITLLSGYFIIVIEGFPILLRMEVFITVHIPLASHENHKLNMLEERELGL